MRRSVLITTVLCMLVISTVSLAAAGHTEGDTSEHDLEREHEEGDTEEEREIEIEPETDRVQIESSYESETGETEQEDEFELDFSVQMDPRIELKTESKTETAENESETEAAYKVRFESLIEFVDENGNGVYDEGESVQTYDLSDVSYTPVNYRTQDSDTVHVIESTSTDGVFTTRLYTVGAFTDIEGEQVHPTEAKIDLEIHDFSFESTDSKLALKTKLSTETESDLEQTQRGDEAMLRDRNSDTFFSWKEQATIDGESAPVESTKLADNSDDDDDDEQYLYLVYDQGGSIIHDPKIGIDATTGTGIITALSSILSQLLSLIGL